MFIPFGKSSPVTSYWLHEVNDPYHIGGEASGKNIAFFLVPCHFKNITFALQALNLSFAFDGMDQQPSRQKDKSFDLVQLLRTP
jgi:hypothetical protein